MATAALAVAKAFTPGPESLAGPAGIALRIGSALALVAALGGAIASIRNVATFEQGGVINGPRHAGGGVMVNAEGGEFIVNRTATARNLPLLHAINGSKFEQGGQVPNLQNFPEYRSNFYEIVNAISSMPAPVLDLTEFNRQQNRLTTIKEDSNF